jgi:hypothetical protein
MTEEEAIKIIKDNWPAGYEWDAEKKEFKKIEQKPSTSVAEFDEEVERFCKECFITDTNEKGSVFCIARHFADWQKNRQKSAWSEEDESMYIRTLGILGKCYVGELPTKVEEELNWLKSLKERKL